jgi:methyl-accepting chemotaxis protein
MAWRIALANEWHENIGVNSQRALAIGMSGDTSLAEYFAPAMKKITERTSEIQKRYQALEETTEG